MTILPFRNLFLRPKYRFQLYFNFSSFPRDLCISDRQNVRLSFRPSVIASIRPSIHRLPLVDGNITTMTSNEKPSRSADSSLALELVEESGCTVSPRGVRMHHRPSRSECAYFLSRCNSIGLVWSCSQTLSFCFPFLKFRVV